MPGKLPIHLEGAGAAEPEDNVGLLHPRAAHRQDAGLLPGGRPAGHAGVSTALSTAPTASSSTAPSGRATSWSRSASAPSAPRTWRTGRGRRRAAAWSACAGAARAARASTSTSTTPTRILREDSRRARAGRRRRLVRSPTTAWSSSCERRDARAAARAATSSSSGCARRASARYHDHHPLPPRDARRARSAARSCRRWVLNRYYYQTRIPIKDALILSKSEDPAFRRVWIRRIHDHDGDASRARAGSRCGCGWPRRRARSGRGRELRAACCRACASPATPTSQLVRERTLVEAVASSLTEFFAPDLMSQRIAAWEQHYPWVQHGGARLLPRAGAARAARLGGGDRLRASSTRTTARAAGALRGGAHPQDRDPVAPARLRRRATASRARPAAPRGEPGRHDLAGDAGRAWPPRRGCASTAHAARHMLLYPGARARAQRHRRRRRRSSARASATVGGRSSSQLRRQVRRRSREAVVERDVLAVPAASSAERGLRARTMRVSDADRGPTRSSPS